jgi:hypothetical protein
MDCCFYWIALLRLTNIRKVACSTRFAIGVLASSLVSHLYVNLHLHIKAKSCRTISLLPPARLDRRKVYYAAAKAFGRGC